MKYLKLPLNTKKFRMLWWTLSNENWLYGNQLESKTLNKLKSIRNAKEDFDIEKDFSYPDWQISMYDYNVIKQSFRHYYYFELRVLLDQYMSCKYEYLTDYRWLKIYTDRIRIILEICEEINLLFSSQNIETEEFLPF